MRLVSNRARSSVSPHLIHGEIIADLHHALVPSASRSVPIGGAPISNSGP
jgi:hypothetical protein